MAQNISKLDTSDDLLDPFIASFFKGNPVAIGILDDDNRYIINLKSYCNSRIDLIDSLKDNKCVSHERCVLELENSYQNEGIIGGTSRVEQWSKTYHINDQDVEFYQSFFTDSISE